MRERETDKQTDRQTVLWWIHNFPVSHICQSFGLSNYMECTGNSGGENGVRNGTKSSEGAKRRWFFVLWDLIRVVFTCKYGSTEYIGSHFNTSNIFFCTFFFRKCVPFSKFTLFGFTLFYIVKPFSACFTLLNVKYTFFVTEIWNFSVNVAHF